MESTNQKKSSGFKGAVAAAVISAFAGGCATVEGIKKDLGATSQPIEGTIVQELKRVTQGYDSNTAEERKKAQDSIYDMVFNKYTENCTFAWNTMIVRANGQHGYLGAVEVTKNRMGRVELHPSQMRLLVDGYEQASNVTEGKFKGKVRVEYDKDGSRGAYHDTARFNKDTFSRDDLVGTARLAGEDFRGTNTRYEANRVWHNVGVTATMGALYVREVTSNVDPTLKKLDPKYKGLIPVGDGISLLALTDGSNANFERVGTGTPGGFQLYCKGPAKK